MRGAEGRPGRRLDPLAGAEPGRGIRRARREFVSVNKYSARFGAGKTIPRMLGPKRFRPSASPNRHSLS